MWKVWVVSYHILANAQRGLFLAVSLGWVSMKCLKLAISTEEWVIELSLPHHLKTSVVLPRDRKVRTDCMKDKDMSQ